jgi:hypothetical protein
MVCYDLRMNDDTMTDLKQFITASVSQATIQQTIEIRQDIDKLEKKLGKKIDDLRAQIS